MSTRLRWGILGTGNIARQFADGVAVAHRSSIVAVGSRTREAAGAFAAPRAIPTLANYDDLLRDPDVDAVYNSLPNTLHHEWTLKALAAGKHVLCEKPFAVNLAQSQEMFDAARRHGLLLVEAFMYRSQPLTHAVIQAVRNGAIGQLRLIRTNFCYRTTRIAGNIRFDPTLAGGGLMDVGCYCTSFSRLFAGAEPEPSSIHASAHIYETGVDDCAAVTMQFPNGIMASFTCGMTVQADNAAYLCGTEGFIEIPVPWKPPVENALYHLVRATPPRQDLAAGAAPTQPRQTFSVNSNNSLYGLEADDFAAAVLDGAPPAVTPQDTLGNMRVLDEIRRQIGLPF